MARVYEFTSIEHLDNLFRWLALVRRHAPHASTTDGSDFRGCLGADAVGAMGASAVMATQVSGGAPRRMGHVEHFHTEALLWP